MAHYDGLDKYIAANNYTRGNIIHILKFEKIRMRPKRVSFRVWHCEKRSPSRTPTQQWYVTNIGTGYQVHIRDILPSPRRPLPRQPRRRPLPRPYRHLKMQAKRRGSLLRELIPINPHAVLLRKLPHSGARRVTPGILLTGNSMVLMRQTKDSKYKWQARDSKYKHSAPHHAFSEWFMFIWEWKQCAHN